MSDAREQSYYEIALTNRQVMSIFIVLLVCLLASFVSGLWIGRQGAGVRVQTADAQRIEGESGAGEAPLGEMDFFSAADSGGEPSDAAGAGTGTPATPEPPPPAAPQPSPAPPPTASTIAPDRQATAAVTPPAAAEPAPAEPDDAAVSGEFLYIQVFSGLDREQAQSIVERLRRGGYAAFLSSVEVDSRLMHRVRIGPYSERQEADEVAGRVQREHKLSTWITP